MFISDTSKANKRLRPIWVHALMAAVLIAVNNIYSLFSHEISSAAMTWMFLYPGIGGSLFFFLLTLLLPNAAKSDYYRIFFNLHNSGIAALTAAAFLNGILEIAGTSSAYTRMMVAIGWTLIVSGLCMLILSAVDAKKQIRTGEDAR